MSDKSYRRIAAVQKSCDILKVLSESKTPLTGNEVAVRVDLPPGTVMCLLATLQDNGFVQEIGGGWKVGLVLALFWARRKADLETTRDRIDRELTEIGG